MSTVHRLTRSEARRVAIRAQLLTSHRPDDLLDMVRHLTFLQYEPTAAIAPSADVVAWSRLGPAYSADDLRDALESQQVVEHELRIRPREDIALFRADMASWPGRGELRPWQTELAQWLRDNEQCRRDILETLRGDGPLPASELPDTCARPWRSSGWTNRRNVQKMLDVLGARGEVAVSGREGGVRRWDLAERIYPDDPVIPAEEAASRRARRRLASLGIVREKALNVQTGTDQVAAVGDPAEVEGVRGRWRVDRGLLDLPFTGRTALLSPLDRLVFDRKRLLELFEFDYQLEMYKPAARRRWGYWAMPILVGDRLVGKLDATADRSAGELVVHAIHEDEPLDDDASTAVLAEIRGLAEWLGLDVVLE